MQDVITTFQVKGDMSYEHKKAMVNGLIRLGCKFRGGDIGYPKIEPNARDVSELEPLLMESKRRISFYFIHPRYCWKRAPLGFWIEIWRSGTEWIVELFTDGLWFKKERDGGWEKKDYRNSRLYIEIGKVLWKSLSPRLGVSDYGDADVGTLVSYGARYRGMPLPKGFPRGMPSVEEIIHAPYYVGILDRKGKKELSKLKRVIHMPWVLWFGNELAERFGEAKLLKAPFWKVEKLQNGIVWIAAPNPFYFDFEKLGRIASKILGV